MIECVLFDSDGTLVDSERLSCQAIAIKFAELGVTLDVDSLLIEARGKKMAEVLEKLSSENNVTLPPDFMPEYRALTAALFEQSLKPIPGIIEVLDKLDLQMAVVSNGPPEKIQKALHICGLARYFGNNIYSAYEVNAWKPDPRLYSHAAHDMGFQPEHCAVVEDTLVGVEAGVNAGMHTFFYNVLGEEHSYGNLYEFTKMGELLELIEKAKSM